ncbi:MAG: outer membrane protein assembly factor BamA [Candidatus Aminicenantes bacterium]|nr:outer membrane protein assembly factor BamA [Candidatus Aminicenantes bacterium]
MKRTIITISVFLLLLTALNAEIIENIIIKGNKKVSRDTILFYMKSKPHEIYSKEILKEDFKSLWKTGFFENIKIETEDGSRGIIIKITLKENLFISEVNYKTGKKIKKEDIIEKLQEYSIILSPFSYFNPAKLKKVERIIKEMLNEEGYNEGKVNINTKTENEQVAITIQVIQGPKTRIGSIIFPGIDHSKVSANYLIKGLEKTKPHGLLTIINKKDIYNQESMNEDLENLKLRLQQKGYLEAKIGRPQLSLFRKATVTGKIQKMIRISIPVEPGPQYRIANIRIEGNKVIKTAYLKRKITLKRGDIYNIKKRNDNISDIQKIYGSIGYCRCQIVPVDNLDPVKKIADLTIKINEDQICYLGKLEFVGNTFTKDHVIRREWLLKEGRRLNMNALEDSIRRMKQLGLVTVEKMPEIKPNPTDPNEINIKVEVKELQRQMINFNLGYSGYEGWFIAVGYSTQNFLGLGEKLTLNISSGTRAKTYRLAFTEPYLFNLPASLGANIFKTSFRYPSLYTKEGQGFNIISSFRLLKFFGAALMLGSEKIEISEINEDLEWTNPYSYYYYTEGKRTINSFSPTVYYSTVDSPLFPSSGTKYLLNYRYSGGILGGDIYLHKYKFEFTKFLPIGRKHVFGMHLVYEYVTPFGVDEDGNEKTLPFYEKFFLGGERSIRGFDIYRIGPKDPEGYTIGGNKAFYVNFEYHIPISQQFTFVLFYDFGNAYDIGQSINLDNIYTSLGLELKVYVPMMGVPFRLIFAYNPRTLEADDSHFHFGFGVGPSFY